jgi:serine/threonine protein kinase
MSPEQGRGAALATDRSDVYSGALVGWRLLAGHLPPPGPPPPLTGVPPGLAALLAEALSPDPARRPSAAAFRARLLTPG